MFSLALISMTMRFAPGRAQRPVHKVDRLVQGSRRRLASGARRRLVTYPYDQGGAFQAPLHESEVRKGHVWTLHRLGKTDIECGPVFPHLLNRYAARPEMEEHYPLGCAMKPPKDQASGMFKACGRVFKSEQERWFMYEPVAKTIHYYEPIIKNADEDSADEDAPSKGSDGIPVGGLTLVGSVPIKGINDVSLGTYTQTGISWQGKQEYHYPTLEFKSTAGKATDLLRLIFRSWADRTAFMNRLSNIQEAKLSMDLWLLEQQNQVDPQTQSPRAEAAAGTEEKVAQEPDFVEAGKVAKPIPYFQALRQMWSDGATKESVKKLHEHADWDKNNPVVQAEIKAEIALQRLNKAITDSNADSNFRNCAQPKKGVAAGM